MPSLIISFFFSIPVFLIFANVLNVRRFVRRSGPHPRQVIPLVHFHFLQAATCLPACLSSLSPTPLPPGLFSSLFSTGPIFRSQMPSNKPPAHPSASSTLGIRAD